MRRKLIAGNWKMNTSRAEGVALAAAIAQGSAGQAEVDVAVCPPAIYLDAVKHALAGSAVGLGAQNCYHEAKGAYTGEISIPMLLDVGCKYVILGHSERRAIFQESNELINKKVKAALTSGLTPILCVGETLEERKAGRTAEVVKQQFRGSLADISAEQMAGIVIAYEPVWAIGTGVTATPDQAEAVHADLRKLLETTYNSQVAAKVIIQYGGSVTPETAPELFRQPNIDGGLVGGASLKPDSFLAIIAAAK